MVFGVYVLRELRLFLWQNLRELCYNPYISCYFQRNSPKGCRQEEMDGTVQLVLM